LPNQNPYEHTGKGKVVPAHVLKAHTQSGGTAPLILNLGTTQRCVSASWPGLLHTPPHQK